jgi:hypothetical protein
MKLRMDKTLRFWVDVAYENVKSDHPKLTKRRLIAQILHQYQDRGDAMRASSRTTIMSDGPPT